MQSKRRPQKSTLAHVALSTSAYKGIEAKPFGYWTNATVATNTFASNYGSSARRFALLCVG